MSSRATVDFGIHLGVTEAAIAVANGTAVTVVCNHEGFESTPSAVWEDKNGILKVGRIAKERLESDPENAHYEFRLVMGTSGPEAERVFARSGRRMSPEQLSAEVLKALRNDVERASGEKVDGAVITVPAAFEVPQCNATREAAKLAGIEQCWLMQEPVAAVLAHLENRNVQQGHWLVFDFNRGAVDAAIVHLRDRELETIAHRGDNALGESLLHWAVIKDLFVPPLLGRYRLPNFRRGNRQWLPAFAKLKIAAEAALERMANYESDEIRIDFLCRDDAGQPVEFNYELRREEVERLAEPFLSRAVAICRACLAEAKIAPHQLTGILPIVRPASAPLVRSFLESRETGLGVKVEPGLDPPNVFARGAAIFARRQARTQTRSSAAAPPAHVAPKPSRDFMSEPGVVTCLALLDILGPRAPSFFLERLHRLEHASPGSTPMKNGSAAESAMTTQLESLRSEIEGYRLFLGALERIQNSGPANNSPAARKPASISV